MNKKYLLIGIGVMICLAVFVVAEGLTHTVIIGAERKTALASMGITNPKVTDVICDKDYCTATLYQEVNRTELDEKGKEISVFDRTVLNTEIRFRNNASLSVSDIQNKLDLAVKNRLIQIVDAKLAVKTTSNKGGAGEIILQ